MTDHPDIFWIVTDEHRADGVGAFGPDWLKTPNLDRLAAEGCAFTQAYCQAPACVASRSSFLSGRYPHTTSNMWFGETPEEVPYFIDHMRRNARYAAYNVGKEHHYRSCTPFTLSDFTRGFNLGDPTVGFRVEGKARGFGDTFGGTDEDYGILRRYTSEKPMMVIGGTNPLPPEKTEAAILATSAIQALKGFKGNSYKRNGIKGAPMLFRMSVEYPHTPVIPPKPFDSMYDPDAMVFPGDGMEDVGINQYTELAIKREGVRGMKPEEIRKARADYYGLCSHVDQQIGRFLDWIRENWERPYIIIFHSDHGNMLGEHELHEKFSFYEPACRVPLIIAGDGVPQGKRIDVFAELVDIAPTIMEYAGVEVTEEMGLQGRSLWPVMRGETNGWRQAAFSELERFGDDRVREPRMTRIRTDRYNLSCRDLWNKPGETDWDGALFDLEEDPHEMRNVFGEETYAAAREELIAQLRDWDEKTSRLGCGQKLAAAYP